MSGPGGQNSAIPLEPFRINKDMGRILLRRNGETVAAGMITSAFLSCEELSLRIGIVTEIMSFKA